MMLRLQVERMHGSFVRRPRVLPLFRLDYDKLKLAKPDALIMHPGDEPRRRDRSEVADDIDRSLIRHQSRWGGGAHGLPRNPGRDPGNGRYPVKIYL